MPIPALTFAQMLELALPGDYLAFWNKQPISYLIEEITEQVVAGHEEQGPSHIISLAKFPLFSSQWFELEACFPQGCRILPLSHYASDKNRMVLCRRKGATGDEAQRAIGRQMECLGRLYDWREEVEIAFHTIFHAGHITATENTFFCSGYMAYGWEGTAQQFAVPACGGNITPMGALLDAGTELICWVN